MTDRVRTELILDLSQALSQIDDLERQLDSLLQPIDIPVNIEADQSLQQLQTDINQVNGQDVDVDVDVTGLGELDELESDIRRIDNQDIDIDVEADGVSNLRRELGQVENSLEDVERQARETGQQIQTATRGGTGAFGDLAGSAKALFGVLAASGVVRQVGVFLGDAVNAASDLEESLSKTRVVFGDFSTDIEVFATTAPEALGLSEQAALEMTATFGNLFTALGLSQQAAADLSPEIVQLGADLASFNNIEVDDALTALRSGLVGEVEPLRRLGVALNAASVEAKAVQLGLASANGEISEAAKVQARYALILEQTTNAQGDFARTSEGFANTQRRFNAALQTAQATIGQALLPALTDLLDAGVELLPILTSIGEGFAGVAGDVAAALGPLADFVVLIENLNGQRAGGLGVISSTISDFVGLFTGLGIIGDIGGLLGLAGGEAEDAAQQFEFTTDAMQALRGAAIETADDAFRDRLLREVERTKFAMSDANQATLAAADTFGFLQDRARAAGVPLAEFLRTAEDLPPAAQEFATAFAGINFDAQIAQIRNVSTEIADLPDLLGDVRDALRDEEGGIVDDFGEFFANLEAELAARREFQGNLQILQALGFDDLADAFAQIGEDAAGALADAIANPADAARAEAALEQQAVIDANAYASTFRDQLAADFLASPVEVQLAYLSDPNFQETLNIAPFGGGQGVGDIIVNINNPQTNNLTSDARRAGNEVSNIVNTRINPGLY